MPAQWSPAKQQAERERKQREQNLRFQQQQAKVAGRVSVASNLLIKHGWSVRPGEEPLTWYLKMPGSAEMLCRGVESLERKTIGMGNPNFIKV